MLATLFLLLGQAVGVSLPAAAQDEVSQVKAEQTAAPATVENTAAISSGEKKCCGVDSGFVYPRL